MIVNCLILDSTDLKDYDEDSYDGIDIESLDIEDFNIPDLIRNDANAIFYTEDSRAGVTYSRRIFYNKPSRSYKPLEEGSTKGNLKKVEIGPLKSDPPPSPSPQPVKTLKKIKELPQLQQGNLEFVSKKLNEVIKTINNLVKE